MSQCARDSYATYLIHFVVVVFLQQRSAVFRNWAVLLVAMLVLSVLFAAAFVRWVEPRVRRVRPRFH